MNEEKTTEVTSVKDKELIPPSRMPVWAFRYQNLPELFASLGRDLDHMIHNKGFYALDDDLEVLPDDIYNATMNVFLIARLGLIMTEVSEAIEAVRSVGLEVKDDPMSEHIPQFRLVEEELADVIIRTLSLAHQADLRVGEALLAKLEYQNGRDIRHGGKLI